MAGASMRIMIVEDEFLVATMIEDMLVEGGHQVVGIADDYDSAVALAVATQPQLAILDYQLIGKRTGLDVAMALASLGVPCMFATGNCPREKAKGLALGCLHKPFSERDLLAAIETAQAVIGGRVPEGAPRTMHLM